MNGLDDLRLASLCLRVRESHEALARIQEGLLLNDSPVTVVGYGAALADLATEILSTLNAAACPPGAYSFVGAHVVLGADIEPGSDADKAAQRVIDRGRDVASITSLLDDTAGQGNSDRDHRSTAAE